MRAHDEMKGYHKKVLRIGSCQLTEFKVQTQPCTSMKATSVYNNIII